MCFALFPRDPFLRCFPANAVFKKLQMHFSKVADAFELPFHILEDYARLDIVIPQILSVNGPALIEVVCDPQQEILEPFESD